MSQYDMIGKWPVTFNRIITAIALSPRAEANLQESYRIAKRFQSLLILVHVGNKDPQTESGLKALIQKVGIPEDSFELHFMSGDPTMAILQAADEHQADLLIAGALQREKWLQYFKGSVARKLCRKANCSLLLLTNPSLTPRPMQRIVVNGSDHPKTEDTIRTAIYVARSFGSQKVTIVEEIDPSTVKIRPEDDRSLFLYNRECDRIRREEHRRLEGVLDSIPNTKDLLVEDKCLFGKKGYTIGHFTQSSRADLLVMNSPDTKLGFLDRVFTHDLEYILSDLPCDLLIVHTTKIKKEEGV